MPKIALLVLVVCGGNLLLAGERGVRAKYVGGTFADISRGTDGRISMTDARYFRFRARRTTLRIRYDRINTLDYGQHVKRRIAEAVVISPLLILSKSRKHFVSISYTDDQGRHQALVFQIHKDDVRSILAGLEARTGRRVEYQDDEARKTGGG